MAEIKGKAQILDGKFEVINNEGQIIKLKDGQMVLINNGEEAFVRNINGELTLVDKNGKEIKLQEGEEVLIEDNLNPQNLLETRQIADVQAGLIDGQETEQNNDENVIESSTVQNLESSLVDEDNLRNENENTQNNQEEKEDAPKLESDSSHARELDRTAQVEDIVATLREPQTEFKEKEPYYLSEGREKATFRQAELSLSGNTVLIEDGKATYTLNLTQASTSDVVVTFSYTGTAQDGTDFVSVKTVTIPAGSKSFSFDIEGVDDNLIDGGKTFTIKIDSATGGGFDKLDISPTNSAVKTVINDETIYVEISVDKSSVTEGESLIYTVKLVDKDGNEISLPTGKKVNVELDWSGVASSGVDTQSLPSSIDITNGSSATFEVKTLDDYEKEGSEPLIATISKVNDTNSSFNNLEIGEKDTANSAIVDETSPNEDVVTVQILNDGSSTEGGKISHTIKLLDKDGNPIEVPQGKSLTVKIDYTGVAQDGKDFTGIKTVTIEAGKSEVTIENEILDDAFLEGSETYTATIGSISQNSAFEKVEIDSSNNSVTGTITDEAVKDVVKVSIKDDVTDVNEGEKGTFPIELKDEDGNLVVAQSDVTVTLQYTGTALDGSDYNKTVTIVIPAGQSSKDLDIDALSDNLIEDTETVNIEITAVSGGGFEQIEVDNSNKTANMNILDTTPLPQLSINDMEVDETAGTATFTVTLSGSTPKDNITVDFTTVDGTAIARQDYDAKNGTLTFLPGETTKTIVVNIKDDTIKETSLENYTIKLSNPTNAVISDDEGLGGIRDAGTPMYVELSQNASAKELDAELLTHNIKLVDGSGNPVNLANGETLTLNLAYTSDATSNDDFATKHTTVTITGNGGSDYTFSNVVKADTLKEGSESYTVSISSASSSYFESVLPSTTTNSATGTITDDVVPQDDTQTLEEGTSLSGVNLLDNDEVGVNGKITSFTYVDNTGTTKTGTVGTAVTTQYGSLTINADGTVSFTASGNLDHSSSQTLVDNITYTLRDDNGDTQNADFTINITDTQPVALADTNSIIEDATPNTVSANVITNDTIGKDTTTVTGVKTGNDTSNDATANVGSNVSGSYGTVNIASDGTYTYTLDNTNLEVQELAAGETLSDTFTYTVTDSDGDTSTTTLTITIDGQNDDVELTIPPQTVYEEALSDGSNPSANTETVNANFTLKALDGLKDISVGGTTLTKAQIEALATTNQTIDTTEGTLVLNGYSKAADGEITIDYTYTLKDNQTHPTANANNQITDSIPIIVNDTDTNSKTVNLDMNIVDDVPEAKEDTALVVVEGSVEVTPTNLLDNDIKGADEAVVSQIEYKNESGVSVTVAVPTDGNELVVDTQYGTLKVKNDGTWKYKPDDSESNNPTPVADNFTYIIKDSDGDTSSAVQKISVEDGVNPTIDNSNNTKVIFYEGDSKVTFDGVNNYEQSNSDDTKSTTSTLTHKLDFTQGTDSAGITSITFDGTTQNIAVGGSATITDDDKGTLTVYYNGIWEYTPPTTYTHPDGTGVNNLETTFSYTVTDSDGDSVTGNQTIQVDDTVPTSVSTTEVSLNEKYLDTGTTPDGTKLDEGQTISIDVSKLDGNHDVTFASTQNDATLSNTNLSSLGSDISYEVSADGHTITLYTGTDASDVNNQVLKVTINNPTSTNPTYTAQLLKAFDHEASVLDADGNIQFGFDINLSDDDKDTISSKLTVKVIDDEAPSAQTMVVDEDSTSSDTANTITTNADATQTNTNIEVQGTYGTATITADGKLQYIPNTNFSGTDTVTYKTTLDDGSNKSTVVTITVNPVADTPDMTGNLLDVDGINFSTTPTVNVNEDNNNIKEGTYNVTVGFKLPVIVDKDDYTTVNVDNDQPEKLGFIEVSGVPAGTTLQKADGTAITVSNIFISDVADYHYTGLRTGKVEGVDYISMTKAEFENLEIIHQEDNATNITLTLDISSYEVNDDNTLKTPEIKASNTQDYIIDIQAVTDDVSITLDDSTTPANVQALSVTGSTLDVTFDEDTTIDLIDVIKENFADTDGSEQYQYEITGLAEGTKVTINGQTLTATSSGTLTFSRNVIDTTTNPNFEITPPKNFSGDMTGVSVTLKTIDSDGDSSGTIAEKTANITLDMYVKPIVDEVTTSAVETKEDTAVELLKDFVLTDIDGSETVRKVVLEGIDEGSTIVYDGTLTTIDSAGTFTIGDGTTDLDLTKLKALTITPPSHSSSDMSITANISIKDEMTVHTVSEKDEQTKVNNISLKVTPVAELVTSDSDGDGSDDVTINSDFTYVTHAVEDTVFSLASDSFNLKTAWANEDDTDFLANAKTQTDSEETFGHLTFGKDDAGTFTSIPGAKFIYNDGTKDITLTDSGSGVDIPAEFLDTVRVVPPLDKSGNFRIKVEAKTVDYDEDDNTKVEEISGKSFLDFTVDPASDDLTVSINPARGTEDDGRDKDGTGVVDATKGIDLDIKVTTADTDNSTDDLEKFKVEIVGVPTGGEIFYDGVKLTPDGTGKYTILNFDNNKSLKFIPQANSDEDFTFQVTARTMDDAKASDPLDLPVKVKDLADSLVNNEFKSESVNDKDGVSHEFNLVKQESSLDGVENNEFLISEVYANYANLKSADDDGSEVITFVITGLADGFEVSGGTFLGGSGTSREYLVTKTQLDSAKIKTPQNFSGEFSFVIDEVTTEINGDSEKHTPRTVEVFVQPDVDATLTNLNATQQEDSWQTLSFDFTTPDTDGSEDKATSLEELSINLDALNTAGVTLKVDGAVVTNSGYHTITATNGVLPTIEVLNKEHDSTDFTFDIKYKVTDTITDKAGNTYKDTQEKTATYNVEVKEVTDTLTLALTDSGNTTNNDIEINDSTPTFTKTLTLSSDDIDGSEEFTRIEVNKVPDGIEVVGGVFVGATSDGGTWYVDIPNTSITATGGKYDLEFKANGNVVNIGSKQIEVVAYGQDTPAGEEKSSIDTFNLSINLSGGSGTGGTPPAVIDVFEKVSPSLTTSEDGSFKLGDFLKVGLSGTASKFTVKITPDNLPDGVEISGANVVKIGNFWLVSGDTTNLNTILDNVIVSAPEDFSTNNSSDTAQLLKFDLELTTYGTNGSQLNSKINDFDVEVVPITDKMDFDGQTQNLTIDEDEDATLSIDLTNNKDSQAYTTIIDGKVYIKVVSGIGIEDGSLSYNGTTLQKATTLPSGLSGDYYEVNIGTTPPTPNSIDIKYKPKENESGNITFEVASINQEEGATNQEVSRGTYSVTVNAVPDDIVVEINGNNNITTGNEDEKIEIPYTIQNPDSSESITTIIINNIPKGYLVYYGTDASSSVLAQNMGTSWNIPTNNGSEQPKIFILPPENVSGIMQDDSGIEQDITITALSDGGKSATSTAVKVDINPVADNINLTPTKALGVEYTWIDINLNANSDDVDGSETATLTLKAEAGSDDLDDTARFRLNDGSDVSYTFDEATKTYTLTDIDATKINDLQMLYHNYDGIVEIGTNTVDTNPSNVSNEHTGTVTNGKFELKTAQSFDIDLSAETKDTKVLVDNPEIKIQGGTGIDTLILDSGINMDFDKIGSIKDIEEIDLTKDSLHIQNLDAQDILDIGATNTLKITGSNNDTVSLASADNWNKTFIGATHSKYEATVGSDTVTLFISNDINLDIN